MNPWLTALAILLIGAGSFWLWQQVDDEAARDLAEPHDPDFFLENMERTTLGEEGEVRNILRAERVTHYPDDDSTELAQPRLEIYNGAILPWYVKAESGLVSSGSEVVFLRGEVEIWRDNDEGVREVEVLTSELRVLPKEQYAETSRPTIITNPSSVTTSIGMRANFSHDRLELLERVRSRIERSPGG